MSFTAFPHQTWLPLTETVERLVCMVINGQAHLEEKSNVRSTFVNNVKFSNICEHEWSYEMLPISTYRILFQ